MLTLTYSPGTIAVAVALALEEAGLDYKTQRIDFRTGEQTQPDYLAINPKGRVPALMTEQGILTETGALLDYVAALAPQAGLIPTDPFQAARMREAMYYCASTMHINHAHKMRGHRWADQESSWADMTAKVPQNMTDCAAYVEKNLLQGPYICGSEFTIGDAYLYTTCRWLDGDGVDLAPFAKTRAFLDATNARASVAALKQKGILK